MRTIRNTILSSIMGPALLAIGLTAVHANTFELEHNAGTLRLDETPQKIVSFELSHLDTLNALGIDPVGVPQSAYAGTLKKFNQSPVVGTLFEPDYDSLKQLQPDLIIAGGRSGPAIPKLSEIAPTVSFTTDPNDFLNSVEQSTLQLARAFNKTDEATQHLEQLEQQIAALYEINSDKTGVLLFTINGRLIPHAPGDRFGYVYELTGLQSVLPERNTAELTQPRPEPGSAEAEAAAIKNATELNAIAQADPDWIIMLDRGAINNGEKTAAETLAAHDTLSQTQAFKNDHIYYADPNSWYLVTGGLNNLTTITADMIEKMRE
ncbi:MAG TPA: ABC transporter substrate-binding protein [Paenalcaligenes sp.]|nr:ABC transporter substrate-binding protein [Paenalcaligenes sp.]